MSIKQKAIDGGKWMTISTIISTVFQFGQITILARLLNPEVFGVVSISTLLINFFQIFSNLGFSNSIIYKQENDRKVLSSIYFLNLLLGLIIFFAIYFSTPLIVIYYNEPRLDKVIKTSSFYFLIVYLGQVYLFLLQKELRFKTIAIIDILGSVISTATTVALAYKGYEEFSLVYGMLVLVFFKTCLYVVNGIKLFLPILHLNLKEIKEHLQFGMYNVGDGVLGFFQGNIDNIMIGGMLGVKLLGYYTIAYQLAIFPVTKLNPIVLQVVYPLLAKMKENQSELKKLYLNILDFISYVNLPLLAGLLITAEGVVPLFYGPGWEESIYLIKIFVFVAFFNCLTHPLYTLAFTKGKPKLLFYLNLITLIVKVPLVYLLGITWGLNGIAYAFLIATFINLILKFLIVHSLIGSFFKDFIKFVSKPIFYCFLMMIVIFIYKYLIGYKGVGNIVFQILIGGLTYVILTLKYKMSFAEIKSLRTRG